MDSNTVLILGAGSSVDYGYPTGNELTTKIGNPDYYINFIEDFLDKTKHKGDSGSYAHGFNLIKTHFFRSRSHSIDNWLAKPENRDCVAAGKLLIAYFISSREIGDFSPNGFFSKIYKENEGKDWYQLLFNALVTDKFEDFGKVNSKLSIVTFNYDRSLEFYLLNAMQSMYIERSEEECWDQLKSISIQHVYGSVGDLPVQNKQVGIAYGDRTSYEVYTKRAEQLRIIPELGNKTNDFIVDIQNKITNAKHIYFVGFSFDRQNLELLGFPHHSISHTVNIYGSTYGLEDGEVEKAMQIAEVKRPGGRVDSLNPIPADAHTFFRKAIIKAF